jgi:hypothetical protein
MVGQTGARLFAMLNTPIDTTLKMTTKTINMSIMTMCH